MSAGSRGLAALFDDLNRRHFGGRLPKHRVVLAALLGPCVGRCEADRPLIRLARRLSPDERRQALLHEMCHIGVPGHGVRWQARMLRLADRGEAWARGEVRAYRRCAETPAMLWAATTDALHDLARHRPRFRLAQVRRICATDCGLPVRDFLALFPRFDRTWERIREEEAQYRARRERFLARNAAATGNLADSPSALTSTLTGGVGPVGGLLRTGCWLGSSDLRATCGTHRRDRKHR